MNRSTFAFACVALAAVPLAAARAAEPDEPVGRFAFLTGCWSLVDGETTIEEHWLPPAGGVLVGVARTVSKGKLRGFEFLRLQARDGAWHYVAQPNGEPPTWFRLTRLGDGEAQFENPTHDFPRTIRYRRVGDDALRAEIAGPGKDGAERTIPFEYRRVACPDAPAAALPTGD